MRDPRCWREVLIRGGMTTLLVGVLYFAQGLTPWVWLVPPVVAGLVVLRWAWRPFGSYDGESDASEEPTSPSDPDRPPEPNDRWR